MNIGIFGNPGSGKTVLAQNLEREYGYKILSFATPLKKIGESLLGRKINKAKDRLFIINLSEILKGYHPINDELTYHACGVVDEYSVSCTALQLNLALEKFNLLEIFGKEYFFVKALIDKIGSDNYVIDDLRFKYEYDTMKAFEFKFVYLDAPEDVCEERLIKRDGGCDPKIWTKQSETEHRGFDYDARIDATQTISQVFDELIWHSSEFWS